MMIRKKIIIIILFLVCACGYSPIYKGMDNINFQIVIVSLSGDRLINQKISNDLRRYKKTDESKKKLIRLNISSDYEKTGISKNLAGEYTSYELKVTTTVDINSPELQDQLIYTEKFNMKNIADKFEQNEYELTIKDNFAKSISSGLISKISQIR